MWILLLLIRAAQESAQAFGIELLSSKEVTTKDTMNTKNCGATPFSFCFRTEQRSGSPVVVSIKEREDAVPLFFVFFVVASSEESTKFTEP